MISHGIKSNTHFGWWSLQKSKVGDVQNAEFSFICQIFSRALEVFIKSFQPWSYSPKNRLSKTGKDWILPN